MEYEEISKYFVGYDRIDKYDTRITREIEYYDTIDKDYKLLRYRDVLCTLSTDENDIGKHFVTLDVIHDNAYATIHKGIYDYTIDPSNLSEFVANAMAKKVLNSPFSVKAGEEYKITLTDPVTYHTVDITLNPEYDGKVAIIDNTFYYYLNDNENWFVDKNNMVSKGTYNNEQIIIEHYKDNSVIVLKDKSVIMNIDKSTVHNKFIAGYTHENYTIDTEKIYHIKSHLYDIPLETNMTISPEGWYEDFTKNTNDYTAYDSIEFKSEWGNTIKNVHAFIPIGYLNILGAIFQDSKNYRIFASYFGEYSRINTSTEKYDFIEAYSPQKLEVSYYYIPVDKLEEFVVAVN